LGILDCNLSEKSFSEFFYQSFVKSHECEVTRLLKWVQSQIENLEIPKSLRLIQYATFANFVRIKFCCQPSPSEEPKTCTQNVKEAKTSQTVRLEDRRSVG